MVSRRTFNIMSQQDIQLDDTWEKPSNGLLDVIRGSIDCANEHIERGEWLEVIQRLVCVTLTCDTLSSESTKNDVYLSDYRRQIKEVMQKCLDKAPLCVRKPLPDTTWAICPDLTLLRYPFSNCGSRVDPFCSCDIFRRRKPVGRWCPFCSWHEKDIYTIRRLLDWKASQ